MELGRQYMSSEDELLIGNSHLTVTVLVGASLSPPLLCSLIESEQSLCLWLSLPQDAEGECPRRVQCLMTDGSDHATLISAAISQLLLVAPWTGLLNMV